MKLLLWRLQSAYVAVLVVEVDDESERPPSHRLCGDEGVLEGGLSAGGNHGAELESREVLDVELVILSGTNRTESERAALRRSAGSLSVLRSQSCSAKTEKCVFVPVGNGRRRPETPPRSSLSPCWWSRAGTWRCCWRGSLDRNKNVSSQQCCIQNKINQSWSVPEGRVTFSFDEQDGGVSVGGRFHLADQRFFFFIFFFFRLHTNTQKHVQD